MRRRFCFTVPTILTVVACVLLVAAAQPSAARAADSGRVYLLRERLHLLMGYIERYANERYSYYPRAGMVRRGGGLSAPLWPRNPWTGGPMAPGSGAGSYTYTVTTRMLSCTLVGHHPGGTIVVRRAIPYTRKMQNDHRSRECLYLIQQYIERWAKEHGGLYPQPSAVAADGAVGSQDGAGCWPHNPWSHLPMARSGAWGDFSYRVAADQSHYSIIVHYSRGGTLTLRGATPDMASATASSPWHLLFFGLD
jgi:hypothetical protein